MKNFNILRILSYSNVDNLRLKLLFFHTGLIIGKNTTESLYLTLNIYDINKAIILKVKEEIYTSRIIASVIIRPWMIKSWIKSLLDYNTLLDF